MTMAIERLREVTARCQQGRPLDGHLAAWFAGCLEDFLERRTESIEQALGLPSHHGGIPWWKQERMRRRDRALAMLAAQLRRGQSQGALAREIHVMSVRYAASAWRIDRDRDEMPAAYAGTPREHLWAAFRSGAPMPLGERQICNILR